MTAAESSLSLPREDFEFSQTVLQTVLRGSEKKQHGDLQGHHVIPTSTTDEDHQSYGGTRDRLSSTVSCSTALNEADYCTLYPTEITTNMHRHAATACISTENLFPSMLCRQFLR